MRNVAGWTLLFALGLGACTSTTEPEAAVSTQKLVVNSAFDIPIISSTDQPVVVAYSSGNYLVVWLETGTSGGVIKGARIHSSDGAILDSTAITIATLSNPNQGPAVTAMGSTFLVVWGEDTFPNNKIHGVRVNASDGSVLGPSVVLSGALAATIPASITPRGSSVAITASSDKYLIGWVTTNSDGYPDSYVERVNAADLSILDATAIVLPRAGGTGSRHISPAQVSLASDGTDFKALYNAGAQLAVETRVRGSDGALLDPNGVVLCPGGGDGDGDTPPPSLAYGGTIYGASCINWIPGDNLMVAPIGCFNMGIEFDPDSSAVSYDGYEFVTAFVAVGQPYVVGNDAASSGDCREKVTSMPVHGNPPALASNGAGQTLAVGYLPSPLVSQGVFICGTGACPSLGGGGSAGAGGSAGSPGNGSSGASGSAGSSASGGAGGTPVSSGGSAGAAGTGGAGGSGGSPAGGISGTGGNAGSQAASGGTGGASAGTGGTPAEAGAGGVTTENGGTGLGGSTAPSGGAAGSEATTGGHSSAGSSNAGTTSSTAGSAGSDSGSSSCAFSPGRSERPSNRPALAGLALVGLALLRKRRGKQHARD